MWRLKNRIQKLSLWYISVKSIRKPRSFYKYKSSSLYIESKIWNEGTMCSYNQKFLAKKTKENYYQKLRKVHQKVHNPICSHQPIQLLWRREEFCGPKRNDDSVTDITLRKETLLFLCMMITWELNILYQIGMHDCSSSLQSIGLLRFWTPIPHTNAGRIIAYLHAIPSASS